MTVGMVAKSSALQRIEPRDDKRWHQICTHEEHVGSHADVLRALVLLATPMHWGWECPDHAGPNAPGWLVFGKSKLHAERYEPCERAGWP
eukprot:2715852-Pyramimonas_sp.AAC.1